MGWPGPIDYNDAFQHPARVFHDHALRPCRVELNRRGMPAVRAGGFALVYKLIHDHAATAVRVFLYPSNEREERYRLVHDHLTRHRPPCLVDFGYQPEGIRVGREWFPIQTMPWVEGVTLWTWLDLAARRGEAARIRRMAVRWKGLVGSLQANQIAHGDLQHGNILVIDDDTPVLVDYDGMCVPSLVGRPAAEVGLPAYQHPDRRHQPLSLELDHASAWIILIALRAVAADPALWSRFVVNLDNENLLFREPDIATPGTSALWSALLASTDREVRDWSATLRAALDRPFNQVPPFRFEAAARPPDSRRPDSRSRGSEGTADLQTRVQTTHAQAAAVERLRRIPSASTPANDRAFRDTWRAHQALLDTCPEAAALRPRLDQALGRLKRHAELARAIAAAGPRAGNDAATIKALESLPPAYAEDLRARIPPTRPAPTTKPDLERVASLIAAIRRGDHRAFLTGVDLPILLAHPTEFQPYRRVIEGWLKGHVLASRPVSMKGGPPEIVGGTATFRCAWGHSHVVRACRLHRQTETDPAEPRPDPATARRYDVEHVRRAGGFVLAIPPGARQLRVTIWPIIDLGWTELRGAPIRLGPFGVTPRAGIPVVSRPQT